MTSSRLSRTSLVADCQHLLAFEPLLVETTTDIAEALRRAARQPTTRLVGVTDDGRLVGVIPIRDLVEAVVARTIPEALMADTTDVESVARFGNIVESRTAADVMLPPASVVATETVTSALREMHRRRLSGLYVVDTRGRPTGYLDALEMAELALGVADPPALGA